MFDPFDWIRLCLPQESNSRIMDFAQGAAQLVDDFRIIPFEIWNCFVEYILNVILSPLQQVKNPGFYRKKRFFTSLRFVQNDNFSGFSTEQFGI